MEGAYGNTNRGRGRGRGRHTDGRGRHTDGGRSRGRGPAGSGYGRSSPNPSQNPPPPQPHYADRQPPVGQVAGRGYAAAAPPGDRRGWEPQQQVAVRPTPSPPPQISTGTSVPDMRSLSITQKSPAPVVAAEVRGQMVPIRRPDKGGVLSKRLTSIVVNHFRVGYNPQLFIRQYDIDIKPEKVSKLTRPLKLRKADFRLIRNQLSLSNSDQFPLEQTVFDGDKIIYSAVELPTGQFKVKYSEAEDREGNTFLVTVKLVNQFDLTDLREYFTGRLCTIPPNVMHGLDVVMKEHPARHLILSGKCFYPPEFNDRRDTIGNGLIASAGFQHSLKPTFQGLSLCVDYSVAPFWKPVGVVEFLNEYLRNFNMSNFKSSRRDVERVLIGLKVQVTHRRTSQKFRIRELTVKDTKHLSFQLKDPAGVSPDREIFLADYFMETYGCRVQHLDVPCLEFGRKDKPNYVPMECCKIVPGQRLPKDGLEKETARRLKDKSVVAPQTRMETIKNMLEWENGPCKGNVIQNFGISVDNRMTKVNGRVVEPPELKIGGTQGKTSRVRVDQERCQWNLGGKCVLEGKSIDRWAVIDFTASDRYYYLDANQFIPSLINRCMNLSIRLNNDPFYQEARMGVLSSDHELRNLLQHVIKKTEMEKKGKPQFILCVMTGKHEGYKLLKWISETEIGIVTQCCLSGPANKGNDQYFANLAMKINAKLGGSNMELFNPLPRFEHEKNVMFVGADVNHPGQSDSTVPSIAAVVATMNWPGANRYAARVQAQTHGGERILDFAEMCFDLILSYERINGRRPDRIIIFRDGVSDTQFDMVLNNELASLKQLFKMQGYSPSLTLIVARKRHLTRLFLEDMREGGRSANISPGTVVDTTIVHPYEFDFYLCSHHGAIGTSKPTHYHVLFDDHGFSSDELQKFIYFLCFTFARCTKPVSLVTPVYYADLVAYRGRMYYEASQSAQSSASSSRSSASAASQPNNMNAMKLHSNLVNSMFFI